MTPISAVLFLGTSATCLLWRLGRVVSACLTLARGVGERDQRLDQLVQGYRWPE
jgi:hypothetical protein